MNPLKVIHAGTVPYGVAYEWQKDLHARRVAGVIPDLLLLLEHPHTYTLGRRFDKEHMLVDPKLLRERGIEVHEADRGGSITYHGPGQMVGYPILDLRRQSGDPKDAQPDVIVYLRRLEEAIIRSVRSFGIVATRREGLTGVWVGTQKIAAIGVNVSRGVSKHGFALNVSTDLSYFEGMVPCGIPDAVAGSLDNVLGRSSDMEVVTRSIVQNITRMFHRFPIEGSLEEVGLELEPLEGQPDAEHVAEVIPLEPRPERDVREAGG